MKTDEILPAFDPKAVHVVENPLQQQNDRDARFTSASVASMSSSNNFEISLRKSGEEAKWYHPFWLVCKTILFAAIYTVLPFNNYWVNFMLKTVWWSILVLISFTETYSDVIPDLPDSLYVLCFVLSIIIAPVMHTFMFFYDMPNNAVLDILAVASSLLTITAVFGMHCCAIPFSDYQLERQKHFVRELYPGDWAAMYTAILREEGDVQTVTLRQTSMHSTPSTFGNTIEMQMFGLRLFSTPENTGNVTAIPGSSSNFWIVRFANFLSPAFNRKTFWFLPRFSDYDYYQRNNELRPDVNRAVMWIATFSFMALYSTEFTYLFYFTLYFRATDSTRTRFFMFFLYVMTVTVYRMAEKFIGMYLDRYKPVTSSLYFIGEVVGLMYYYTFYRVIFESIKSIPEFALFQFIHLAAEWILYVGRSTETYYHFSEYLGETYFPFLLQKPRLSHRHWQRFIALDFGIRCVIFLLTGIGILLLITIVQFAPYLAMYNDLSETLISYQNTALFLVAAVILEFLNAWAINEVYFKKQNFHIYKETLHCFALPNFYRITLTSCSMLLINPIFAFTVVAFAKH